MLWLELSVHVPIRLLESKCWCSALIYQKFQGFGYVLNGGEDLGTSLCTTGR